ncbi:hypothetical protein PATSB16_17800 [Pandoraea thiooxydans]|nr:hypothetical protein PATSB16_17800 [Pandoraea thiooxydans]
MVISCMHPCPDAAHALAVDLGQVTKTACRTHKITIYFQMHKKHLKKIHEK